MRVHDAQPVDAAASVNAANHGRRRADDLRVVVDSTESASTDTVRALKDAGVTNVGSASAPMPSGRFVEPWHQRVTETDDATIDSLLRHLLDLRRIKSVVTIAAAVGGAGIFGSLPLPILYAALMHLVFACSFALPAHAAGTLVVRVMFLREARRHGLSRSASMLLMVRAERKARHLRPFTDQDAAVDTLVESVREWDRA